jgi:hypothetical protein
MAIVQIRDVPDETLDRLKAQAAERRTTLAAYLRDELDRLAARPSNAEIMGRLRRRDRHAGPSLEDSVQEIRTMREAQ